MTALRPTRRTALATTALGALLLSGCAAPGTSEDGLAGGDGHYPVTVDNCGVDLTFAEAPGSVITIGTAAAWMLHEVGADELIVARAGEFGAELPTPELAEALAEVPIVDPADPNAEKVIGSGADTALGYGLFNADPQSLEDAGIANIMNLGDCGHDDPSTEPPAVTIETVFADLERLGTIFDTEETAAAAVERLRGELDELAADAPEHRHTAVVLYYFSSSAPFSVHGGVNISTDVLDRAGLDNVYAEQPEQYLNPNIETLLEADPDYIILSYGFYGESFDDVKAMLLQEPGAEQLTAVVEDRLIGIPTDDLAANPGIVDGLRQLIEALSAKSDH